MLNQFLKKVEAKYGYTCWDIVSHVVCHQKNIKLSTWLKCFDHFQKYSPAWFDKDLEDITFNDQIMVEFKFYYNEDTTNKYLCGNILHLDFVGIKEEAGPYKDFDIYITLK